MSESKFTSEAGRDPSVNNTLTYTNPIAMNPYVFMSDAYYGTGGFRTGNYLMPHDREAKYNDRKKFSHYRNYVKPVVRALIEPVFMEEAVRTIFQGGKAVEDQSKTLFGVFIEDCDNNGTPLQEFTEGVMVNARLHGVTFVVMDNFPSDEQPATPQEAIDGRIMPYVYNLTADLVDSYKVDQWGRLTEIVFIDKPFIDSKGRAEPRFRLWNAQYSQLLKKDKNGRYLPAGPQLTHDLGRMPVTVVMCGKKRYIDEILVDPPMYDIARINLSIYNKDSEIREQERAQAFSIFYIQTDNIENMTVGVNNVIGIPESTTIPPGFASPDSAILAGLVDNNNKLAEALYQIAEQNGVKGVQSAKSGVAIQWDFYAQESQLKRTSKIATLFELLLSELYKDYTNGDFEYVVEYPTDFLPGDTAKELDNIAKVFKDMKPPRVLINKLQVKVAKMLLQDETEEDLLDVIKQILDQAEVEVLRPTVNIEEDPVNEEETDAEAE
jgi:hypothetical protein